MSGMLASFSQKKLPFLMLGGLFVFTVFSRGGIPYWSVLGSALLVSALVVLGFFLEKRKLSRAAELLIFIFAAWTIFYLLSLLFTQNLPVAGPGVFLFLGGVGIFLFVMQGAFASFAVEKFLKFLVALGVGACGVGVYYYLFSPFNRFAGTFADPSSLFSAFPNAFANFLLMVLPPAFLFFLKSDGRFSRWFFGFSWSLFLSAFVLTFSRGAWAALFVTGVLFAAVEFFFARGAIFKRIPWKMVAPWFVFAIVLVFGLQFLRSQTFPVNTISEKVTFSADEGGTSIDDRLGFLRQGMAIFQRYPLTGAGPETFRYVAPQFQEELLATSDHPHNFFLKILSENGLLTFVSAVLFFLGVLMFLWRNFSRIMRESPWAKAVLFACTAALLHNMVDFNFNFASVYLLFWLLLGFLLSSGERTYLFAKGRKTSFSIVLLCFAFVLGIFSMHETYYNIIFRDARRAFGAGDIDTALPLLQKSEPLLFKRDWPLTLGQAHIKNGDYKAAADSIKPFIDPNIANADLWNFASELAMTIGDTKFGLAANQRAIELNPKNNLAYYAMNIVLTLKDTGQRPGAEMIAEMDALLRSYINLLKVNAHLTILTENPHAARSIAGLMRLNVRSKEDQERFLELEREVVAKTLLERQKFQLKYPHVELPPL